jgi:carboxyl-terminal processing protease
LFIKQNVIPMANRFYINKNVLLAVSIGVALAISSCKKDDPLEPLVPPVDTTITPGVGTRAELTKDSLFLYAKQVYLWNKDLPTYEVFNPRQFNSADDELDNYNAELFAITRIPINPTTSKPYEYNTSNPEFPKYSYIDDITDNNAAQSFVVRKKAAVELDGSGFDLGFFWFIPYGSNTNYSFYVMGVYPNSPAAKAGITRGAIINKVNGKAIGTNYPSEYLVVYNLVEEDPTTATISGVKADGTPFTDVVLTKTKYTTSPVFATKTFTAGTKKIGYLAFSQFSNLEKNARADLDAAFSKFAKDGVSDLIIDLRYNGGGFVNTAEYMINLMAPASATGTMFTEYYNETMQKGEATILENQPLLDENDKIQYSDGKIVTYADIDFSVEENTILFSKQGNLTNVANVVFLVTGNTASASELVINSLKPHLNVKLVGRQTYGKPVGFFPIKLEKKYDVYMSMFESKNSLGKSDYYAGFTPDLVDRNTSELYDDATHDFGDSSESYTKAAIGLLAPGATVTTTANAVMSIRGRKASVSSSLGLTKEGKKINQFIGMIETRHQLKKNK